MQSTTKSKIITLKSVFTYTTWKHSKCFLSTNSLKIHYERNHVLDHLTELMIQTGLANRPSTAFSEMAPDAFTSDKNNHPQCRRGCIG